jgi:hypothetical protein
LTLVFKDLSKVATKFDFIAVLIAPNSRPAMVVALTLSNNSPVLYEMKTQKHDIKKP